MEPVNPFNVGSIAVCETSHPWVTLTEGSRYVVRRRTGTHITIVDDDGDLYPYPYVHFRPVRDNSTPCEAPENSEGDQSEPDPYEGLYSRLMGAFEQASEGKGQERHGNGQVWEQQPIFSIAQEEGLGFLTGQAKKKIGESRGMTSDAAVRELRGAIVYLAAAIQCIEEGMSPAK